MVRKVANTVADPTLPKTPIEIGGKTYFLCFDLGALAEAEQHFMRQGLDVNLMRALPGANLNSIRVLFPCALHKFHPEILFADAQAMITILNVYKVGETIQDAWNSAVPETEAKTETANPPTP